MSAVSFEPLMQFDAKTGFFDSFPFKNVYNDVLCMNGSKVTALNVFSKPKRLHYP